MPFPNPAVDMPLTKGSGDTAKTPCFSAICRTFFSGGIRIRTGDTMIFSHLQKPLGMRKTRVGMRIYVHCVPLHTTLFCPYCCATVDTAFARANGPVLLKRAHAYTNQHHTARSITILVRCAQALPSGGRIAPEPGGGETRHLLLEEVSRSGYDLEPLLDVHTPQCLFVHPDHRHVASPDDQERRRLDPRESVPREIRTSAT
jgi:hypothetical protein